MQIFLKAAGRNMLNGCASIITPRGTSKNLFVVLHWNSLANTTLLT